MDPCSSDPEIVSSGGMYVEQKHISGDDGAEAYLHKPAALHIRLRDSNDSWSHFRGLARFREPP